MNAKRNKRISAQQLIQKLENDPGWVQRNSERELARASLAKEINAEEAPLIDDLHRVGEKVTSVWDLVNTSRPYPAAIPILADHLQRRYRIEIREGIIRALTVTEARGVVDRLILDELKRSREPKIRWVLANALTVVAVAKIVSEMQEMIADAHYSDVSERLKVAVRTAIADR